MIQNLKTRALRTLEKYGFERRLIEKNKILDKSFKVRKGTIRTKQDKDDAWLFQLSKDSKFIFDIGANIGQSAMLMMYNNPEKVVLVDPNPRALSMASENLICNNLGHKAIFYTGFVSESPGNEIDFYTLGFGAAGSKFKSFAKTANKFKSHYKVSTLSIDQISEECKIIPDLIKIDVEGAEIDALNGSTEVAKHLKTRFFVEIHSGEELPIVENTSKILDWCKNNLYQAIYLTNMKPLDLEDIKNRGRYHVLLLPSKAEIPKGLLKIKEGDQLNSI